MTYLTDEIPETKTDRSLGRYLPGWAHRSAHQDAVDSILVPLGLRRKVKSQGDLFRNYDRWTLNFFASQMLSWAEQNPGRFPTRKLVRQWVDYANSATLIDIAKQIFGSKINENLIKPVIVIATTPDRLPRRLALALRGGAFHEALHTAYDIRDNITFEEVWPIVTQNWGLVDDWSKYARTVLFWMNEFSDVKNELRGAVDYPGIEKALVAVHDYRIEKEFEEIQKLKKQNKYKPNSHSFALKTFRYLAFGYNTKVQEKAIAFAYEEDPRAVAYVMHGPLAKFVQLARQQWELPRTAKLDLAMKIVATFRGQGLINPEGILAELLRREANKLTWGHCRISPNSESDGGTSAGYGETGSSIAEDALKSSQHETTMGAVASGVQSQVASSPTPITYDHDKVYIVSPSSGGITHDRKVALDLTQQVRQDITFYRSRLRSLVKAQEITREYHGLPEGIDLSDECLVDTVMDIKDGRYPTKAFYDEDEQIDVSAAFYMLMDMSASMFDQKIGACKITLSVAEAASDLGCATMASGFYSTDGDRELTQQWIQSVHGTGDPNLHKQHYRPWGVRHEVFKLWDEKHHHIRWRFSNYQSSGGTPMADGLQFALNALQERREGHRIMFVVTDGSPDPGTTDLIKDLLALAERLEIHVVGVGFGYSAQYVESLFKDSVWDANINKIPRKLIAKLNRLLDFRGTLVRGRKSTQRVVPKRG